MVPALLGIAVSLAAPSAVATYPGRNGPVAVVVADDGPRSPTHRFQRRWLVTAKPDGSSPKRSAFGYGFGLDIAASPDGHRLALTFAGRVVVGDSRGDHRRTVARGGSQPSWSPDGQSLAFHDGSVGGWGRHILVAPVERGAAHILRGAAGGEVMTPKWSPRGNEIAFLRAPAHNQGFALEAVPRGGGRARVIFAPRSNETVRGYDWAPDGRRIVLEVYYVDPSAEGAAVPPSERPRAGIDIIGSDGRGLRQVFSGAAGEGIDSFPLWSPDGKRIGGVCHTLAGTGAICTSDADGGHMKRLASLPGSSDWTWFPRPR
jgi:Tol biopolymer transport system component